MLLAATTEGIYDVHTGDAVLTGVDVGFVSQRATETWALVGGRGIHRETGNGWTEVAHLERGTGLVAQPLDDGRVLIGTTGAHVLRVAGSDVQRLAAFDAVPGRDEWKNPAAGGRPDVWSFAYDGGSVFVSVHVGGLWRSDDNGESWSNALAPATDVHEIAAAGGLVAVAAEHGFGLSRDAGNSWSWTTDGLHAAYLQCVTLTDNAVYVGASSGPFADDAAVYRASPPGAKFERCSTGLPEVFEPIGPGHLVADGDTVALAPWSANTVFVSRDAGAEWAPVAHQFPTIHSLAVGPANALR
jgi:hypothetical protein